MAKTGTVDRKTVDAVLKSLLLLERAVEQVFDNRAVVAACGTAFSPSKVRMLKLIAHSGKQSVGQVARFLGVSDPAASQLTEALVRQKLIIRNTDPKDRRTAYLRLTTAGQKLTQSIEQEQRHRVRLALRAAGNAKAKQWNTLLQRVTQSLSEAQELFETNCLQCGSHEDRTCVLQDGPGECLYRAHSARQALRTKRSAAKKPAKKSAKYARRKRVKGGSA